MTAEIAIMNKTAVTMAADSAVTLVQRGGLKVFRTTNKLFAMEDDQPVGMMTYGNALLMGIPWETLICMYAQKLGDRKFDKLEDYTNDFIGFLSDQKEIFTEEIQEYHLNSALLRLFTFFIKNEVDKKIRIEVAKGKKPDQKTIKKFLIEAVQNTLKDFKSSKQLPGIPPDFARGVMKKYAKTIDKNIDAFFQKYPTDQKIKKDLEQIVELYFERDVFLQTLTSGIVIAGFGDKEIYPSIDSILIEGKINNVLKWKNFKRQKITVNMGSSVMPFAQIDMVYTFMEGIDPIMDAFIKREVENLFMTLPDNIAKKMKELSGEQKKIVKETAADISKKTLNEFFNKVSTFRKNNHSNPVIGSISAQPPYELAMLAESLINLTSLKQRVTLDVESVGGPVDVAIISKSKGFTWVRKKQFYPTETEALF